MYTDFYLIFKKKFTDLLLIIIEVCKIKKLQNSILDEIDGVGEVKKIRLLNHFGSISAIKRAIVEEIYQ